MFYNSFRLFRILEVVWNDTAKYFLVKKLNMDLKKYYKNIWLSKVYYIKFRKIYQQINNHRYNEL